MRLGEKPARLIDQIPQMAFMVRSVEKWSNSRRQMSLWIRHFRAAD